MKPKSLYVFDLDKTLIKGNGSFKFYFFLYSLKFFPLFTLFTSLTYYVKHRFFQMPLKELHEKSFDAFLKGKNRKKVEDHAKDFLDKNLSKMINPVTYEHLKKAKAQGHYTMILSSSPDFLVKPISEALFVDEFKATNYKADEAGNFSHIDHILLGREKARYTIALARKFHLTKQAIYVFTDSICDLPLARVGGNVYAVNPDRGLRNYSKKRGWTIL